MSGHIAVSVLAFYMNEMELMNERVDEWWCVKAIKAMRESVGGKKIPCSVLVDKVLFYVPQAGSVASLMGFA